MVKIFWILTFLLSKHFFQKTGGKKSCSNQWVLVSSGNPPLQAREESKLIFYFPIIFPSYRHGTFCCSLLDTMVFWRAIMVADCLCGRVVQPVLSSSYHIRTCTSLCVYTHKKILKRTVIYLFLSRNQP